ncbi:uncharacterized protein LOC135124046 [Zophobas morio]|uniref:uncharacterized protein LOC135124046 n=1 Tax=Zophobas morio TaxID=2755281 RepID=UPI003083DA81
MSTWLRTKRSGSQQLSLTDMLMFPRKWTMFKREFRKRYSTKDEDTLRKQIYFPRYTIIKESLKKYKEKATHFRIKATQFSDLTEDEIETHYRRHPTDKIEIVAGKTAEEQWQLFKKRMNKKFNSPSGEDIPKLFFFLKIKELAGRINELQKIGLTIDTKDIDRYCDFRDKNAAKTLVEEIEIAQSRKYSDRSRRKSSQEVSSPVYSDDKKSGSSA